MDRPARSSSLPWVVSVLAVVGALAAAGGLALAAQSRSERSAGAVGRGPAKPNVVMIMTDDQDLRSLRFMPNVRRYLVDQGTTFTNSFVTYSLCCPSRTTFLTGQYAHNHHVLFNAPPSGGYATFHAMRSPALRESNSLPAWMTAAGYHTAHIGKYLNGYGNPARGNATAAVPPGWREWHGSLDPSTYRMYNFTLLERGKPVLYPGVPATGRGYQTDVYADKAVRYIDERAPRSQPFFLSLAFLAPHAEAARARRARALPDPRPAPRHAGDLARFPLPRPPSFNEADVSDKLSYVRFRPLLGPAALARLNRNWHGRMESLLAVDEAVGRIVGALRAAGELDRTLIMFTSDNGFMHGEHRIPSGKYVPFEESLRVPLILRGPGVRRGARVSDFVANTDLAPTIVDAAKARARRVMDGRSLLPLARSARARYGRPIVIETGPQTNQRWYQGVRTGRWSYVEHSTGERELYDLRRDPYELRNVVSSPRYRAERARLAARLRRLKRCSGRACWK